MTESTIEDGPGVTVVLCVRNGEATLDRQLAALAAQDDPGRWELVLVDNGSTDGTRALVERRLGQIPGLRVVEEPRPGLNRARNRGVDAARGPAVLFCDADDEVSPAWVRLMVEGLRSFDIVGGALDAQRLNRSSPMKEKCDQQRDLPSVFDYRYAVGANLGFAKRVFESIGRFDERFGTGFDEVEFCLRAQLAGYTIGFVPSAVVHYRVKDTVRGVIGQRLSYGAGNQRLIAKAVQLGVVQITRAARWRTVAVEAMKTARRLPDVLHARTRLLYLSDVAYLTGQLGRLAGESASAGSRTICSLRLRGPAPSTRPDPAASPVDPMP